MTSIHYIGILYVGTAREIISGPWGNFQHFNFVTFNIISVLYSYQICFSLCYSYDQRGRIGQTETSHR